MAGVPAGALWRPAVAIANPLPIAEANSATSPSTWMEQGEFTLLTRALEAADDSRWSQVRSLLGRMNDPGAQALVRWRLATDGGGGLGFADLRQGDGRVQGLAGLRTRSRNRQSGRSRFSGLTSDERIAWL